MHFPSITRLLVLLCLLGAFPASAQVIVRPAPSSGGGGGTDDHAALDNLDFASAGHTGFQGTLTNSAGLAAALSDENGSGGGFVRATSPTFTTPVIGAATGTSLALTQPTNRALTVTGSSVALNNAAMYVEATQNGTSTAGAMYALQMRAVGPAAVGIEGVAVGTAADGNPTGVSAYAYAGGGANSAALWANYSYLGVATSGTATTGYLYYAAAPEAAISLDEGFGLYAPDFAGSATRPYYAWFDSRGVYRILEDSTTDGGNAQAIPALYNPRFAKYTPGGANLERGVGQWVNNVYQIGTEAGGSGTLRGVEIIGASLTVPSIIGVEQSEPANPAANSFVLYAKDNGSGKTQLCVRFASGASQCFAVEP